MNESDFKRQFSFSARREKYIGVEEEHWLVDHQFQLVPRALHVLEYAGRLGCSAQVRGSFSYQKNGLLDAESEAELRTIKQMCTMSPELSAAQIELQTNPSSVMEMVKDDLYTARRFMRETVRKAGVRPLPVGVPPFAFEPEVTPLGYYGEVSEFFGDKLKYAFCAGTHYHISITSAEQAIIVYNALRTMLPLLLAISANSPFADGKPTGWKSTRYQWLMKLGKDMIPPFISSWDDYYRYMQDKNILERPRRNLHFLRFHPLGTIEVRICDCMQTIQDVYLVAALIKIRTDEAITHNHLTGHDVTTAALAHSLELSATYGFSRTKENAEHRKSLDVMLDRILVHAEEYDPRAEHDVRMAIRGLADNTGADRLLKVYHETGNDLHAALTMAQDAMLRELK